MIKLRKFPRRQMLFLPQKAQGCNMRGSDEKLLKVSDDPTFDVQYYQRKITQMKKLIMEYLNIIFEN